MFSLGQAPGSADAQVCGGAHQLALKTPRVSRIHFNFYGQRWNGELAGTLGIDIEGPALYYPALSVAIFTGITGELFRLQNHQAGYLGYADASAAAEPAIGRDFQGQCYFLPGYQALFGIEAAGDQQASRFMQCSEGVGPGDGCLANQ